jgi:UDP-N-acetylglucosamine 2-epimerase (non-hydrolysing)
MMRVVLLAGARPNFMKIAPLIRGIEKHNSSSGTNRVKTTLVHSGQHYDHEMSQVFFQDLELPKPDVYLGVGSGTHSEQIGKTMMGLEKVLLEEAADLVIVVGDVNSTLAGALAAVKSGVPAAHVEAGLRSYDKTMPEEINRLLTDAISDYLFTPSLDADDNLKKEGIPAEKIFLVGNVMVDSLLHNMERIKSSQILSQLEVPAKGYALLTMHRPSNVDGGESLLRIGEAIKEISMRIPIIFPIHPRTRKNIEKLRLKGLFDRESVLLIEPLGYLDFLKLTTDARFVMTDSGGIQEETTVLKIPCLTLRDSTERPITIAQGTNTLVGNKTSVIIEEAAKILEGKGKKGSIPPLWDGRTAERIVDVICQKPLS